MATSESKAGERPTQTEQTRSTLKLAGDVLENPDLWLITSNPQLGNRRPIDLIGTEEEFRVYNLLNAVNWGLF